jgi:uncharacterized DUF497 family protein
VPSILGKIEGFEWLHWVVDKIISKHDVDPAEVEECFANWPQKLRRVQEGKYQLFGQSNSGRYLLVVFAWNGRYVRVITARDMDSRERAAFRRK